MICNKKLTKEIIDNLIDDFDLVITDIQNTFDNIRVIDEMAEDIIPVLATIKDNEKLKAMLKYYSDFVEKKEVFIKLTFDFKRKYKTTEFQVERIIYKYLLYLADYQRTPNIVKFVGAIRWINPFDNIEKIKNKSPKMKNLADEIMGTASAATADIRVIYLLVNESVNGITFRDLLQTPPVDFTENDLLGSIFQISYTLNELYLHDIIHGDMHLGNILVEILPEPATLIYFTSDKTYYQITTKFIPKLFDFNMSTFTAESGVPVKFYNSKINDKSCSTDGMCSTPNSRADLFYFIGHLVEHVGKNKLSPVLSSIICSVIINPELLNVLSHIPIFIRKDTDVRNFSELISDSNKINPFLQFKKNIEMDGYPKLLLPTLNEKLSNVTPKDAFDNYKYVYISAMVCDDPRVFAISLLKDMKSGKIKNSSSPLGNIPKSTHGGGKNPLLKPRYKPQ